MGSTIEINDTLQLTSEQGFPKEPKIGVEYEFLKDDIRIFHPAPTRVFLVQNIEGKWIYWGHVVVTEQTIHAETKTTSGKFRIVKIYSDEDRKVITRNEAPEGRSFY